MAPSPRSRFVTVYGRVAVLEALADDRVAVDKVLLARGSKGPQVDEIVAAAKRRGIPLDWASADRVTRISRNGRHDQGVVADLTVPGMAELDDWLASAPAGAHERVHQHLAVLDGVTNPGNVGMILRAVTAAGLTGTVVPRFGCADIGPLVIKASAGVALRATILRADTTTSALEALAAAGYRLIGLRGTAAGSLFGCDLAGPAAFVLGNETDGISDHAAARITEWISIPMDAGVESLNVATAAAVVAYELARRRLSGTADGGGAPSR